MMGFWNVTPRDLEEGDEIRVHVMGGEEYLMVREVKPGRAKTRVRLEWGGHISLDPFWDTLPNDESLTVRR